MRLTYLQPENIQEGIDYVEESIVNLGRWALNDYYRGFGPDLAYLKKFLLHCSRAMWINKNHFGGVGNVFGAITQPRSYSGIRSEVLFHAYNNHPPYVIIQRSDDSHDILKSHYYVRLWGLGKEGPLPDIKVLEYAVANDYKYFYSGTENSAFNIFNVKDIPISLTAIIVNPD